MLLHCKCSVTKLLCCIGQLPVSSATGKADKRLLTGATQLLKVVSPTIVLPLFTTADMCLLALALSSMQLLYDDMCNQLHMWSCAVH